MQIFTEGIMEGGNYQVGLHSQASAFGKDAAEDTFTQ